jgi:hypothetical protein
VTGRSPDPLITSCPRSGGVLPAMYALSKNR